MMKCPTCPAPESVVCYGEIWGPLCTRNAEPEMRGHLAASSTIGLPTVAESRALIARIKACPFWSRGCGGCQQGQCAIGKGKDGVVTFEECGECLDGP